MKRARGVLALLLCGLLLLAGLPGCAAAPVFQSRVELKLGVFAGGNWGVPNPNSYVLFDEAIARFEAANPHIKVSYRSGTLREDYSEWCAQKVLQDEMPDVFLVLGQDYSTFASLGILKNLDGLVRGDANFDTGRFYASTLRAGQMGGVQYALPYETAPTMMFVNKTLLDSQGIPVPKADWTWDDFYAICEQVTGDMDGNGVLDQFGCYGFTWRQAAFSGGNQLFNPEGTRAYFNNEAFQLSLRFAQGVNSLNGGQNLSTDDFDKGNVAFCPFLFSDYRAYKPYPYQIKRFSDFVWDCLPLPAGPEGENVSELQTLLMGMSARTKHEDEAWELLKYFTSDEDMQLSLLEYSHGLPVIRSVTESVRASEILQQDMPGGENFVDMGMLSAVIEKSYVVPNFKKYEEAMALADSLLYPSVYGNRNIDTTLKQVQREVDELLDG